MHGRKGRKQATLPEHFEERISDGKIQCKICLAHHGLLQYDEWIQRGSLKSHEKSLLHQKCLEHREALSAAMQNLQSEDVFVIPHALAFDNLEATAQRADLSKQSSAEVEMWDTFEARHGDNNFEMDTGVEESLGNARQEFEEKLRGFGLWGGLETAAMEDMNHVEDHWNEAEQDDILNEILKGLALEDKHVNDSDMLSKEDSILWHPYGSKLMFLLDTIDNLPRLRISGSLMRVLLWLLQQAGVKHVPSFDALRKVQRQVRDEAGVPTIDWMSPKGNAFSFNDPRSLIANDWMNPIVAPHIRYYPVIPENGIVSEVWHARKWRHEIDRHILSPMYDGGGDKHFFIDEPALLSSNKMVVPIRWLQDEKGIVWADAWEVEFDRTTMLSTIRDDYTVLIKGTDLQKCMLDLQADGEIPQWSAETISKGHPSKMPNPDRELAAGDPLYTSFIDIFGDDVSGNRSKSWNKHWNVYITHRNLPRKFLNQPIHTHFVSTSQHASVPEQFQGIKEIIEETHRKPVQVRNAANGKQTRFKIYCNCAPGDNPSQSETSGHIGGGGNHPCRKCDLGGTQKMRETDDEFHASFFPGNLRSSDETLQKVEDQIRAACLGVAQDVKDLQTKTGVKDAFSQHWIDDLIIRARSMQKLHPLRPVKEIQTELMTWVNENKPAIYNSFLTMPGFDPSRDTPVEILHTILLGVVKYVWYGSHSSWTVGQQKQYSTRLQATDTSGLSIHPIRASYIMQYANSLIGRQLKSLVQVNTFHVYDLVGSTQFLLTKAIGELAALLWFPEIRNLDEYLLDVETAAANVLDIAAIIDPSKINSKIKYHLLCHLREDVLRFGPLVGVATEVFECFNAIFRYCSILSNHLAPSRDIAHQLAEQETAKHLLSGGWWQVKEEGRWSQAGSSVRKFIKSDKVLQMLIGWGSNDVISPVGTVKLLPLQRGDDKKIQPRLVLKWSETAGANALNASNFVDIHSTANLWQHGKYVVAKSQDQCSIGSWIYANSPFSSSNSEPPITGRIIDILQAVGRKTSLIILDVFEVSATRHDLFGMPILKRRLDEKRILAIPATAILFEYNVQHNCRQAGCVASGKRAVLQERVQSGITEAYIEHKPVDCFLINTHAFHNAHLIRAVLPRDLTAPIPFAADRRLHHNEMAQKLRINQESKRAAAGLKAAEKKRAAALKKNGGADSVPGQEAVGSRSRKRKRAQGEEVEDSVVPVEATQAERDEDMVDDVESR